MNPLDRYPETVFWSDEDDAFVAIASDLPGCSAVGKTREEALAELRDAKAAWVDAANAAGNPLPEPSPPPQPSQYSGRFLLRMPRTLHARLAAAAEAEGVSLNQHMVFLLASSQSHSASGTTVKSIDVQTAIISNFVLGPPISVGGTCMWSGNVAYGSLITEMTTGNFVRHLVAGQYTQLSSFDKQESETAPLLGLDRPSGISIASGDTQGRRHG